MISLSEYPKTLQLLMQTDGTVTELIKLLAGESIKVVKIHSEVSDSLLIRQIYLQGEQSKKNWLFANSKVYLNHLSEEFVSDLLEKSKPIGTLWSDYKMETFKEIVKQELLISDSLKSTGFIKGMEVLSRTYDVFNNKKPIMRITENFPCELYNQLLF